eukprot:gene57156-biopygen1247
MPGGNNPTGALGHVGAALELAEQVADPDAIFLALGSSCTTAGLCVGVAAARRCGLAAFRKRPFRLHAVVIHDGLAAATD